MGPLEFEVLNVIEGLPQSRDNRPARSIDWEHRVIQAVGNEDARRPVIAARRAQPR